MEDLNDCITADGLVVRPFPPELFGDKGAVLRLLHQVRDRVGKRCAADEHSEAPYVVDRPLDNMIRAVEADCLSVEDIRAILTRPLQFHQMLDWLNEHAEGATWSSLVAESIDVLGFALELAMPDVDRLRGTRCHFELAAILASREPLICTGAAQDKTPLAQSAVEEIIGGKRNLAPGARLTFRPTPVPISKRLSPRQLLASWAWEKKLRNDKLFKTEAKYVVDRMQNDFGKKAPYWMFSLATRLPGTDFTFFAFDEEFRFDPQASHEVTSSLANAEFKDPSYPVVLGDTPLDHNVLLQFCTKFSLEMAGTPFVEPPLQDELHIFAQQVLVSGDGNAVQMRLPAFYTDHRLESLLDTDLNDLKRVFDRETRVEAFADVRRPDENTCPLGDKEMGKALQVAHKALKKSGMTRWQSFLCVRRLSAVWWTGQSGQSKGTIGTRKTKAGTAVEVDCESGGRLSRFVRDPEPRHLTKVEREYKPPSRAEITRIVQEQISDHGFTSQHRYAWAKLYRQLRLLRQI